MMLDRIAFAGDWHANPLWAVKAIGYAASLGAQAIVHVGDYGWKYSPKFCDPVEEALAGHGLHLYFVDGNHEDFPRLYRYPLGADGLRTITPHTHHMPRGYRWNWGGVSFLACGGAHSVDRPRREPGLSWWPDEKISETDVTTCTAGGTVDVLVSHDCPYGVDIPGIDGGGFLPFELYLADLNRMRLREIVDAVDPTLVVHGHYHVQYEKEELLGSRVVRIVGLSEDESWMQGNVRVMDLSDIPQRTLW